MFNSVVLDVAIGLIFCYASVALIVSSINEALASIFEWRSKTLLQGVKALLNDYKFEGLARDIYNHAMVNPRGRGDASSEKELKNRPSYIDPGSFATSLIESIQSAPGNYQQLGEDINAIQDPQLKQMLQGMYRRASGDMEHLHAQLVEWFDAGMARVSGSYKRQSQLYCFLIALSVAALFNIDSFHLFKTLWEHPAIAAQIALPPDAATATHAVENLKTLPIGWLEGSPSIHLNPLSFDRGLIVQFFGWLVTASAALFGAPFWFDLLQQLTRLRGTGPKPEPEKNK